MAPSIIWLGTVIQCHVRMHKVSGWLYPSRLTMLSRIVDGVIRVLFAARIPAQASIDPTVHFSHNALAVVLTWDAQIGARCQIGMQVLLGSRWPIAGGPILEEDVVVHAGAKVIGPVRIGRGSVIGANAVVLTDIPPYSLAVGVPAVIKKSAINVADYRDEELTADVA
jgi:serine O-acetyltransferase